MNSQPGYSPANQSSSRVFLKPTTPTRNSLFGTERGREHSPARPAFSQFKGGVSDGTEDIIISLKANLQKNEAKLPIEESMPEGILSADMLSGKPSNEPSLALPPEEPLKTKAQFEEAQQRNLEELELQLGMMVDYDKDKSISQESQPLGSSSLSPATFPRISLVKKARQTNQNVATPIAPAALSLSKQLSTPPNENACEKREQSQFLELRLFSEEKQKALQKWLMLWGAIFILLQFTKLRFFFYENQFFDALFNFMWATTLLLDAAFAFVYFFIHRGDYSLVRVGMLLLQVRLLVTCCQVAQEDLDYWNYYYEHRAAMSKTSTHEAYTAYRAFVFGFTALAVFFNTFLNCLIANEIKTKVAICGLSFGVYVFSISIREILPLEGHQVLHSVLVLLAGFSVLLVCSLMFAQVFYEMNSDDMQILLKQKQESNQYKRMINSINEAMVTIREGSVSFANRMARRLFFEDRDYDVEDDQALILNAIAEKKIFKFKNTRGSDEGVLPADKIGDGLEEYTLLELANEASKSNENIYTFHRELAECTSLHKIDLILDRMAQKRDGSQATFDFFITKSIKMQNTDASEAPEVCFELIDISQKIFADSISTEKQYLTYMNSTVSHEMRNPLNSINAQISLSNCYFREFQVLLETIQGRMTKGEISEYKSTMGKFMQSSRICESSCKLLLFNVEDILALPKLKEGRFSKVCASFDLKKAVEEIVSIQKYISEMKDVSLTSQVDLPGNDKEVLLDMQRFQQVVLNYQSNALKFVKSEVGKVHIVVQLIPSLHDSECHEWSTGCKMELRRISMQFYGFDMFAPKQSDDQILSPKRRNSALALLNPCAKAKVVLSVFDNGIGIREENKGNLFKLFGCLDDTRNVNTQGIGLGLVISKMITEEFSGQTQLFSAFGAGSVFQSSFMIEEKTPGKRNSRLLSGSFVAQITHPKKSLTHIPKRKPHLDSILDQTSSQNGSKLGESPRSLKEVRVEEISQIEVLENPHMYDPDLEGIPTHRQSSLGNEVPLDYISKKGIWKNEGPVLQDLGSIQAEQEMQLSNYYSTNPPVKHIPGVDDKLFSTNKANDSDHHRSGFDSPGSNGIRIMDQLPQASQRAFLPEQTEVKKSGFANEAQDDRDVFHEEEKQLTSESISGGDSSSDGGNPEEKQLKKAYQTYQKLANGTYPSIFFNQKKILIIDDEPFNCQVLKNILAMITSMEFADSSIDLAFSGSEALDLLEENLEEGDKGWNCHYDLILTDCSMPIMDGYECCEKILARINQLKIRPIPKIVAVTGHVESEYLRRAMLSGMEQVLPKPVKSSQIEVLLLERNFKIKVSKTVEAELKEAMGASQDD